MHLSLAIALSAALTLAGCASSGPKAAQGGDFKSRVMTQEKEGVRASVVVLSAAESESDADHWAVAVPVNRSHSFIAATFATQNAYPREALPEAILRFVEEDLAAMER